MWSLLCLSLGRGRDGEHKVQGRTYVGKERQNLSVNHINTSDGGKQTKIPDYISGTVCNVKKTIISMVFRDVAKAKL